MSENLKIDPYGLENMTLDGCMKKHIIYWNHESWKRFRNSNNKTHKKK